MTTQMALGHSPAHNQRYPKLVVYQLVASVTARLGRVRRGAAARARARARGRDRRRRRRLPS